MYIMLRTNSQTFDEIVKLHFIKILKKMKDQIKFIFISILLLIHQNLAAHFRHFHPLNAEDEPETRLNWTVEYTNDLALLALDFAAAAFSPDPRPCLAKNGAELILRVQLPCDLIRDECWAFIALSPDWIVFSVRGTRTQTQLIIEIVESMTEPKKTFPAGGSVQHYFYER